MAPSWPGGCSATVRCRPRGTMVEIERQPAASAKAADILFERRGNLGLITLNRPHALNALTLDMMRALDPRLDEWEADPRVQAVAIRGAGERAFCASGDVRALYDSREAGDRAYRAEFYREEYPQNR